MIVLLTAGGLIKRLSADLTERLGSGFSLRNLQRMRRLYLGTPVPATKETRKP